MKAIRLPANPEIKAILPGASFLDCRQLTLPGEIDAPTAARLVLSEPPAWVDQLMSLRNRLTALAGLKPADIPSFPKIEDSPRRQVMGMDDRHLDFRIVVLTEPLITQETRLTIATVVRVNNLLGRLYLAVVTPFHHLIVARMLALAAKRMA